MALKQVINEVGDVLAINTTVLSVATFSNLELVLKILLLVVSIVYTIDKWWYHKNRRKWTYPPIKKESSIVPILNIKKLKILKCVESLFKKLKESESQKSITSNLEKGINLLIIRDTFTKKSIIGKLFINGEWMCDTLELPYKDNQRSISSIPAGQYKVRLRLARESASRDYLHLLVEDVKDRSYILFHRGNSAKDSRGCILVGIGRKQDFVHNSVLAMDLLMKEILNLGGTNINLIIKNK
mgnify:CR=1 FL=1